MKITELLLESGALDAALRRGWVRIKYLKLDGTYRILMATTNPGNFSYIRKGSARRRPSRIISVWENRVGWRSLRRNRIKGWEAAGPIEKPAENLA